MVIQRDVPRTAAFAWSPGSSRPLIATGTRAGAVDADFSSETQLELWDLALEDAGSTTELKPVAQIDTDSRFHDITWVQPTSGHERGIIAGALENGSLDLWDAAKLLQKQDGALMSRTSKHSGAIKALQFNTFRPEMLATSGQKGELYIYDTNNIANPYRLGNNAGRMDDFECQDWNKQVPHIMVTGSNGGFVTVWDVRAKKENMTLNNNGRKAVSAVAWDPEKSTRLITAVPLDTDPVILVWDLRNSNAPEKVLHGHEGGVLSLSWCQQDHDLLLSCGKDNRTICWNPQTGTSYGDFPIVTNWTFQTRWNPHNPSLLATASFDGKIAIRTIQNTKQDAAPSEANQALDGADFFDKAATQPQTSSFSLPKPPKWLERPVGASFGFGGKIISFSQASDGDAKGSRQSQVRISTFAVDSEISDVSRSFAETLADGDLKNICETHISGAENDAEKDDWKVIETLVAPNPRKEFVRYLGLSTDESGAQPSSEKPQVDGDEAKDDKDGASFFDNTRNDDTFFSQLASSSKVANANKPFQLYAEDDSEVDKQVTRALIVGQFQRAMELCLEKDRLSDAFMIAICGGQSSIEKVQAAYFKKQASGPKYVRLLASVIGKSLWDVVHNADLANWKEVMTTLCTYASSEEFSDLCEALGDRLQEQSESSGDAEAKQSASFCYMTGSKLDKVVGIWIAQLQETEQAKLSSTSAGNSFSVHARALQDFIEKVTVFRQATQYKDTALISGEESKLAPLYEKYVEYADIVAAHGQLQIAEQYLKLLPSSYQTAATARDRVQQATKKAPAPQAAQRPLQTGAPAQFGMAGATNSPQQQYGMQQNVANPYAPQGMGQPGSMYAPQQNQYGASSYQPQQQMQQPPIRSMVPPPAAFGGPPRSMNASPAVLPASKATGIANWNDTPEDFFKPPTTSRRGTPSISSAPNATNQQPRMASPPSVGHPYGQMNRSIPQPVPPPPKGNALPPKAMNPPPTQSMPERPSSSATSAYAPAPGSQPTAPAQFSPSMSTIPRGASPYNVPPTAGLQPGVGSRYAPAPAPAPTQTPNLAGQPFAAQRSPPPPNPYAPQPNASLPQAAPLTGPPPAAAPPPMGGPPPGPGGPPPSGPSSNASAPPPSAAKAPPRHPPGDRTHIPPNAQPVFEILNTDMQRVKSKAPASFKAQVTDTEKRLNILFDNLNNETLLRPNTVADMVSLAEALQAKDFDKAQEAHLDIMKSRPDECTNWMVGVKRLIGMSKATP